MAHQRFRRNILWDSRLQEQAFGSLVIVGTGLFFLSPILFPCSWAQKKSVDIRRYASLGAANRAAVRKLSQERKNCSSTSTISHRVEWTMQREDDCYLKYWPREERLIFVLDSGGANAMEEWKNVSVQAIHAVAAAGGRISDLEKQGAHRQNK